MRKVHACFGVAAALVVTAGLAAGPQASQGSGDDHPALPPGEGRDVMIRVCSECHSPDQAADQQLDRAGWKDLVDKMASKGATATEEEFAQIVEYLVNAFPATR